MRKFNLIIIIALAIGLLIPTGFLVLLHQDHNQTESTTKQLIGTITNVEFIDNRGDFSIKIYTKEFTPFLLLTTNNKYMEKNDVASLQNGQTILFRVKNKVYEQMQEEDVIFLSIVSLDTTTKSIYSLEEQNQYVQEATFPTKAIVIVVSLLVLSTMLFHYLKNKKTKPNSAEDNIEDGSLS